MMKRTAFLIALLATSAPAADWTKLRRIAQASACAASMVDAGTTLRPGLIETNAVLGAGSPKAGRIIGLKIGLCAGQIAYAEYIHHRRPNVAAEQIGTLGGFGAAGFFSILAWHNAGLR